MKRKLTTGFLTMLLMLPMLTWIPSVSAEPEDPTWEMCRPKNVAPNDSEPIDETVHNANTTDEASVGIGVNLLHYKEDWSEDPFLYDDGITFRVALTANTRKGISYYCLGPSPYGYEWIDAVEPIPDVTGDNSGAWLNIPLAGGVRFYGGPGYESRSAEYNSVWVCSNGFLSFDSEFVGPPPSGTTISDAEEPNSLLAVHWADLLVDEQAEVTYYADLYVFVVCWKNVLNENNGKRQTFEVIIEDDRVSERGQNVINFLYQDVTWADSGAIVGIQDQEGYKASSGYEASSGEKIQFRPYKKSAEIKRLKIRMEKTDSYAFFDIDEDPGSVKGINIMLENDNPDPDFWFEPALTDLTTLLLSSATSIALGSTTAGFIVEVGLITLECAADLAHEFSPFKYEEAIIHDSDDDPTDHEAYIHVKAQGGHGWPVDAAVGAQVHWVFTDDNTEDHSVKITAEMEYTYYDDYGASYDDEVSTSVDLSVYIGQYLSVSSTPFGTTNVTSGWQPYGSSVVVLAIAHAYFIFDYWDLDGSPVDTNPITVTMDMDHNLAAYFAYTGGLPPGGGGCPYVSTWNGTTYVLDNNLLLASEASNGSDVIDYYVLQQSLVQDGGGTYSLMVSEFENEHDFFDRAQLIAVDHSSDLNVAVSPYGEILTYTEPSPPVSAIDDNNKNVKQLLGEIDGDYYEGYNGSYIVLNFEEELDVSQGAKLVMRADLPPEKIPSIHVQVQDEDKNWNTVTTVIPRVYWATEIIDLSEYLPDPKGNLKVRLHFTAEHKIDFLGLDTSPQAALDIHEGQLDSAIHSVDGNVSFPLLYADDEYATLMPEQEMTLTFTLPSQTVEYRDYLLITEGHYYSFAT